MAQNEPIRHPAQTLDIPDKLYFRIGDVAKLCEVPAYVLRFWEIEFPQLKPNKGGTGQRLYRKRDVEIALRIKRLLYEDGYTIPGARHVLRNEQRGSARAPQLSLAIEPSSASPATPDAQQTAKLGRMRRELADLLRLLSNPPADPRLDRTRSIRPVKGVANTHHLSLAPVPAPGAPNGELFSISPSPVPERDQP